MATYYKSDESFVQKLALGAAGVKATIEALKAMGFRPMELERGSTGFKIWKRIKIKRVRVPDILCLDTGLRFESRAKTTPEISMSHSLKDPRRAWYAGLRDDDFVAITVFAPEEEAPLAPRRVSPVQFVGVGELRKAFDAKKVKLTQPKGVEEGSEVRVIWPSSSARQRSVVEEVSAERMKLRSLEGAGSYRVMMTRKRSDVVLRPQVQVGEIVEPSQFVASVVPVATRLTRPSEIGAQHFVERLESINLSERYAAAKALRFRGSASAKPALMKRVGDPDEDLYVQLEAAAALAVLEDAAGWDFLEQKLSSPALSVPLETQLETIIVASEIAHPRSEHMLMAVLSDSSRHEELRAGAAWALGEFASATAAGALTQAFDSSSIEVRQEAARALLRIAEPQVALLVAGLGQGAPAHRDGLAWVLARTGGFDPGEAAKGADDSVRRWLSYVVGVGKAKFAADAVQSLSKADPEVYFAATVLWQVLESWIAGLKGPGNEF